MLHRYITRAQHVLQTRGIVEDEDDDKGKQDSGEEVQVLRGFVEGGGVLEDAEMAGAGGHEVEPLPLRGMLAEVCGWERDRGLT